MRIITVCLSTLTHYAWVSCLWTYFQSFILLINKDNFSHLRNKSRQIVLWHIINDKNSIQFPFDTWNNFTMAQRLSEQLHTFFGKVWKSLRKIVGNMQKQLGCFQKLLSKQEENLMHQLIWLRKSWQVYIGCFWEEWCMIHVS